ncbi:MAG: GNAT family N-acetyltransferase [Ignavibacterium sp.]|nr:MAG: GNAT family N-acetyltransferase [Ignavibacterium sp.]
MSKVELVKVTSEADVRKYGLGCITNPKHPGFETKIKWLNREFENGLTMLILNVDDKSAGMIEYTPAEHFWRPVKAEKYLMIHCFWIVQSKYHGRGYGSQLIDECIKNAKQKRLNGVGVVTSSGPWMADKRVFIKNGFKEVESKGRFKLLVKQLKKGTLPTFIDWNENQISSKEFKMVYTNQCPMFAKCIPDLKEVANDKKVSFKFSELKLPADAQNAPSGYGVMNILKDGKVVADHYISSKRFENIIKRGKS